MSAAIVKSEGHRQAASDREPERRQHRGVVSIEYAPEPDGVQEPALMVAVGKCRGGANKARPNGTIWVQHVRGAAEMTEEQLRVANFIEDIGAPDWDVLDREGRYLGVVTMPDRFAPRMIAGHKIYGVWRDELDVQYAVVLRIIGPEID